METILSIVQIILAVLLIITILMQRSEAGLGGAFGGGDMGDGVSRTRRGFEKFIFNASIILGVLFAASALVALFI